MSTPRIEDLKFILFLVDSRFKGHSGKVFDSLQDAQAYAIDAIAEKFADKYIIGTFLYNPNVEYMHISRVKTFGFKGDSKDVDQFVLF